MPSSAYKRRCTVNGLRIAMWASSAQLDALVDVGANMGAELFQQHGFGALLVRTATSAGAEARGLGQLRSGEKSHVLSRRSAAGTGRAAEDSCGGDAVEEPCFCIASHHLLPGAVSSSKNIFLSGFM